MERVVFVLMFLVLSSFVVAESSEIVTSFNVGVADVGQDYIYPASFWDNYGWHIGVSVVVLLLLLFYLKSRSKKRVKKKRSKKK